MLKFLFSKKLVLLAMSFDFSTSMGMHELNPVLGRGTFGARQAAIGTAITVVPLLIERHIEKRHPEVREQFGYGNMIVSGVHIGLGASNLVQRGKE
jgi:hypothetical protein